MESSFCGCDQGALAGLHLDTEHLKAIGRDFCRALSMMKDCGDDWVVEKYVKIYRGSFTSRGRERAALAESLLR